MGAGFFVFEDLGDFQLKGKKEPVRAYSVSREISGQTRLEVSRERGLTPLVGRERELASLTEVHRRAAAGEGGIVLLAGEPGVGKSRLMYEFLRQLDGTGALELETTCVSYGRAMAYRPIMELLRRYLSLSEGITVEELRHRVAPSPGGDHARFADPAGINSSRRRPAQADRRRRVSQAGDGQVDTGLDPDEPSGRFDTWEPPLHSRVRRTSEQHPH